MASTKNVSKNPSIDLVYMRRSLITNKDEVIKYIFHSKL